VLFISRLIFQHRLIKCAKNYYRYPRHDFSKLNACSKQAILESLERKLWALQSENKTLRLENESLKRRVEKLAFKIE
jgi:cell division protein FtsB